MSPPLRPAERAYSLSTRAGWEEFVTSPRRQRPDPLTRAQLRKLSEAARAGYEERRSVWHANLGPLRTPQMRAVHEDLDDIVEANRQDGDKVKGAAVIDAYPGLGKSTIAQVFAREFHQRQISTCTRSSAPACLSAPSPPGSPPAPTTSGWQQPATRRPGFPPRSPRCPGRAGTTRHRAAQ